MAGAPVLRHSANREGRCAMQNIGTSAGQRQDTPLNPGDEEPRDAPGGGEDPCMACRGTGMIEGQPCTVCGGTGKVLQGIGSGWYGVSAGRQPGSAMRREPKHRIRPRVSAAIDHGRLAPRGARQRCQRPARRSRKNAFNSPPACSICRFSNDAAVRVSPLRHNATSSACSDSATSRAASDNDSCTRV